MTLEESAKLFTKHVFDTDDPVKVQLVFTLLRMASKASSRDIRHKAIECLLESHPLGVKRKKMKLTPQFRSFLQSQGYYNVVEIEGKGVCATQKFMFTTGLVYGLNQYSYKGRYCYETKQEAETALKHWDGENHPLGMWIKHKGLGIDERNPLRGEKYIK